MNTDSLLNLVASHPWIDVEQAAALLGADLRQVQRALGRAVSDGLVQRCNVAGLCTHGALYAVVSRTPSSLPVRVRTQTGGVPNAVTGRAFLRWPETASPVDLERALLQIESLWGARNLLVDVARREKLIEAISPARLYLPGAQKGPSLYPTPLYPTPCLDVLAWGTLRVAKDGGELPFVIEWDLGDLIPEAYRHRFDVIYKLGRQCNVTDFPVFVVVTTNRVRAMQLLWLWHEAAGRCDARLLRLYVAEWSAVISGRSDVWWRAGGEEMPVCLFHGEAAQTVSPAADRPTMALHLYHGRTCSHGNHRADFSAARALASGAARYELTRAHLTIPDRATRRVLRKVANWPLLSATEIARLLADEREANVRSALCCLVDLNLIVEYVRPPSNPPKERGASEDLRQEPPRYYLATLGVRLLAAASGMEPGRYVRYRRWPRKRRPGRNEEMDVAGAALWRGDELDVGILLRHFEHTRDVRSFFVSLADTARRYREMRLDHALLVWDESECRRYYRAEGRKHALVPDSGGVYRIGQELYEFFLEVDRGTMSPAKLRRKFGAYYVYRQTGEYLRGGTHLPRLLVIVPDEGRVHLVRKVILERAKLTASQPLEAWIAIQETLDARGPAAPVWRHVVDWKMRCCFAGFERDEQALPRPLDLAQLGREVTGDINRSKTMQARRALKGELALLGSSL